MADKIQTLQLTTRVNNSNKVENMAITVALPRAASRCARTLSHSRSLAHPLDRTQNSFALARSRSSTYWPHSLKLALTRSLSLELVCLVLQNHSVITRFLHAIPQMNEFAM